MHTKYQNTKITQNKHTKTKARFSRLLRHPVWKSANGEGLFLFQRFINLSLTCLYTYPLTYSPRTHTGHVVM